MIIKRRYTKSFVTLENTLVRDRRLSLDEHGMLHYLLSLPDDWEVSRTNCAKFWNIGRDKAARIFRALRKCGWAKVERIHGEDGTFLGVRWVITDEPGEEVPEEMLDQEPDGDEDAPATAPAEHHDTENPAHGQTVVRTNHAPEKAYHGDYIDTTKTESEEKRLPQSGGREKSRESEGEALEPTFTGLVQQWPSDHVLSRVAAEQAWQRLGRVGRHKAFNAEAAYLDDCRRNSRKVCDLTTYLREERFERLAAKPNAGKTFVAKPYSAQWYRWREYRIATGQPIKFMEAYAAQGNGWVSSTEWPPAMPEGYQRPEPVPSADSTGPPQSLMREEDYADLK